MGEEHKSDDKKIKNTRKELTEEEMLAKYPSFKIVKRLDNSEWAEGVKRGKKIIEYEKRMASAESHMISDEELEEEMEDN